MPYARVTQESKRAILFRRQLYLIRLNRKFSPLRKLVSSGQREKKKKKQKSLLLMIVRISVPKFTTTKTRPRNVFRRFQKPKNAVEMKS